MRPCASGIALSTLALLLVSSVPHAGAAPPPRAEAPGARAAAAGTPVKPGAPSATGDDARVTVETEEGLNSEVRNPPPVRTGPARELTVEEKALRYRALGLPTEMFTVMFAIGRLPGWIAQWKEMVEDSTKKIARPRQIYVGRNLTHYAK